ncbi:MarR family transcriptional regulator [uncultured Bifidobacterium sp.]|uniref:MarR family transcriptional regulator n=1 Tax=uncultured Bifidobacterium sp. TaxID=165187 RepID=UPI0025850A87|nr:MarR family transcriptional regulator [uncultured Bifidobacterium sp.]
MSKCLKPFDLTVDEWLIMDTIAGHGGITMSGLAQDTVLPAATLSRLVDRLVDEALLYRKANPFDRRQIQVYVSQRGMRLMEKIAEDLSE